jgi:hypothetical protein
MSLEPAMPSIPPPLKMGRDSSSSSHDIDLRDQNLPPVNLAESPTVSRSESPMQLDPQDKLDF